MAVMCVVLMTFLASPIMAFNVDLKTALIHEGMNGSMFGYAVAQHVDQSTNWLLIGAPTAETDRQPGVENGGAVYRCKTDRLDTCHRVPFDDSGNRIKFSRKLKQYLPIEEKSNQWFGATIQSSGESGVIVACAPRYVYFGTNLNVTKREPVGACWVSKTSTTTYERYSPCSKAVDRSGNVDLYHQRGYCQFGFSAAFTSDGRRLMIAAPGSWYWQGQLYNLKMKDGGKVYATNREGTEAQDDAYRGYSSAIGRFDGDEEDDYVVGIPKGDNYVGMIEMYTQEMVLIGAISGEQIGSYFGGSLAVTDLNGDRLDDIIVGAPMYTSYKQSDTWDWGRVYIYYQQSSPNMFKSTKRDILDGMSSRSRFGMALSGLGDINYDGYDDLCVGAPFAGEDHTGAIYIYHGSKKGIITEASQVIYASAFKSPLSTFGASISSGIDQDGNAYPDLLVGAYDSNKAVFLRTRPVVRVYASLKLDPEKINLETKSCTLIDRTRVTCLRMFTCFKYDGVGLPDELYFDLEWTLDAKEGNNSGAEQRVFYFNNLKGFTQKETVKISKKDPYCTQSHAYVTNDPADKLSPIRTNLEFKLNLKTEDDAKSRRKRELQPILDTYIPTHTSFTVQILKNCGEDEICIPDLFVTYIRVDIEHIVGSSEELEVLIIVGNNGEDSFNTKLYIELPPGVDYSGKSGERSEVPISCDPLEDNSNFVVCNMGNPMTRGSKSEFTFRVKPTNSNETQDSLDFILRVNSSNPEESHAYENNQVTFSIPVTADTKINLFGKSSPEQLNATEQLTEGKGRLVRQVFVLDSYGISPINETELQIRWPSRDILGQPVLTIDGPLKIVGNGKCEIIIITPNNASRSIGYSNRDSKVVYRFEPKTEKTEEIKCSYEYCTIIQCLIGYMTPYSSFSLTVHSRLKVGNFLEARRQANEDKEIDMYHLVSVAHARVRSVPYDFKNIDKSKFPVKRLELTTKVSTERFTPKSKDLPLWVYIVSIVVGILLLLLLILLFWCCGFFKRKKPETEEGYFTVNGKNDIDSKYVD